MKHHPRLKKTRKVCLNKMRESNIPKQVLNPPEISCSDKIVFACRNGVNQTFTNLLEMSSVAKQIINLTKQSKEVKF